VSCIQHGQVFALRSKGPDGRRLWAYRYRLEGRGSKRVQRGGFASERCTRRAPPRTRTGQTPARPPWPHHALRTGRRVPRPARRRARDDRQAALASEQIGRAVRGPAPRRARTATDRCLAPDRSGGTSLRSDPSRARFSPGPCCGSSSTPTPPSSASATPCRRGGRCGRLSPGPSCTPSPPRSGHATPRWSSSPRRRKDRVWWVPLFID
jgi:hypothetical protein